MRKTIIILVIIMLAMVGMSGLCNVQRKSQVKSGKFEKLEKLSGNIYDSFQPQQDVKIRTWGDLNVSSFDDSSSDVSLVKVWPNERVEFIVKLDKSGSYTEVNNLLSENVTILSYIPESDIYLVLIGKNKIQDFVNYANSIPAIKYVEPNYYQQTTFTPNDPSWGNQWSHSKIGMETAWDVSKGSRNIKIAVLDSGVDYTHPDLVDNYLPIGYDWVNSDNDPMDDNGHGTYISGVIAGSINNNLGIAGIANVSFFAEKFLDVSGYGSSIDASQAIDHAVSMGVDIITISWGSHDKSLVISNSITDAINAGVIVIAAAGNNGDNAPFFPAALDGVTAVSATDQNDLLAIFSNYGDWVDIAAPGASILSTMMGGGYGYYSGTSLAVPHVAGLAALIMSFRPEYSQDQIMPIISATAVDLGVPGVDHQFGWGRINADRAMACLYGNNVRGTVSVHKLTARGYNTSISTMVTNTGLSVEYSVKIHTYVNGSLIQSDRIPILNAGSNVGLNSSFNASDLGIYNVTVSIQRQPEETFIEDNVAQAFIQSINEQIFPQNDNRIVYGGKDTNVPFEDQWSFVEKIAGTEYRVQLTRFDTEKRKPIDKGNYTFNTYTREYSGYWELFPYWINTSNFIIGKRIDIFYIGHQEGEIIGETNYDYFGEAIPVWIVNISSDLWYYSNKSGVLLKATDFNTNTITEITFTDIISLEIDVHNIACSINEPRIHKDLESNFSTLFRNTGLHTETLEGRLFINNSLNENKTIVLDSGGYRYLNFTWTPAELGIYNITLVLDVVTEETYTEDNLVRNLVNVYELENYGMYVVPFYWYDAYTNGYNLPIQIGGDNFRKISLPFTFNFYGMLYNSVYITPFGRIMFVEPKTSIHRKINYPTGEYSDLSLFGELLEGFTSIYVWNTTEYVVIEYFNCDYWDATGAGTFEVVLYSNGTILFQYLSVENDKGAVIGVNYGYNTQYYSIFDTNMTGKENITILLTTEYFEYHDITVSFDLPTIFISNTDNWINITVKNLGTVNETDIELSLWIDSAVIDIQPKILDLNVNEEATLNYCWKPLVTEYHNLTVQVEEMLDEFVTENNLDFTTVYLRGITIHDPTNNTIVSGSYFLLEYTCTNIDSVNSLDIYVNDQYTTKLFPPYGNLTYVPVFENLTNKILLRVIWNNSLYAESTVFIISEKVLPKLRVEQGDYIKWYHNKTANYTFIFTKWLSEYMINVSFTIEGIGDVKQHWCVINILNGYIVESSIQEWQYNHFYYLDNRILSNDSMPCFKWNAIIVKAGNTSWGDYEVYRMESSVEGLDLNVYFLVNDSLCVFLESTTWNTNTTLLESNLLPPAELIRPIISNPIDIELDERETGRNIRWVVSDEHPHTFQIFVNASIIQEDTWVSGESIIVNLDNLQPGYYNYTIVAVDQYNNQVIDTVIVYVKNIPDTPYLKLLYPVGGEELSSVVTILWEANDSDGDSLYVDLFYWDGNSWETIKENVTPHFYEWDTSDLKNGDFYKIRVIISDGTLITLDESNIFSVKNLKQKISGYSLIIAILGLFGFRRVLRSKRKGKKWII